MEGKPSTSKCQTSPVFDDDNPEEITDTVHYCLHLLKKGKYVMIM
jgi:hypothetical protein